MEEKSSKQIVLETGAYDFFAHYLEVEHVNPGGVKGRQRLIDTLDIPKHSHILEVGCGNGSTACLLADKFDSRVTAVDISDEMIERAQKYVTKKRISDRVTIQKGDVTELPFADNHFDAVVMNSVLMFVDQKIDRALSEIWRVLKPGGRFSTLEFCWRQTPDDCLRQDTYDICACNGLSFYPSVEWANLVQNANFQNVVATAYPFDLFSVKSFLQNEGALRAFRIGFKMMLQSAMRKRMLQIWQFFTASPEYYEYAIVHGLKPVTK